LIDRYLKLIIEVDNKRLLQFKCKLDESATFDFSSIFIEEFAGKLNLFVLYY